MELLDSELMFNTTTSFDEWVTVFTKDWNSYSVLYKDLEKAEKETGIKFSSVYSFVSQEDSQAALAECIEMVRNANFKYFMLAPIAMFNGNTLASKTYLVEDPQTVISQLDTDNIIMQGLFKHPNNYSIRYGNINEQV